jgi:beta-galactosidase
MVFPDRTPKPAMWEHRQLAAPVRVTSAGGEPGAPLEIENRQSFRDLSWLRADLELTVDGRVVRSWAADLPTLRPAERAAWPLEVSVPPGGSGEVWLTARFRTVADLAWAAAGEEICWAQVPLGSVPASPAVAPPDGGADPLTRRPRRAGPHVDDDGLLVDGLLTRPPVLCLWRAPTDNDRIGGIAARWHEWGVDDLSRVVRSVEGRGTGTVEVRADIRTAAGIIVAHRVVLSTGQLGVRLDEEVVVPAELADLARVGTVLETVAGLEELIWWGRGPHESYPDRKRGAAVGRWESTVTDQHVGYIKPQEEGGHADVRSVALRAADGRELSVRCGRPSQVSVSHFDAADLAAASHVDELRPRPGTVVHIDAAHRGLGTASCGPDTLDRYLVGPGTYTWSWELVTATMP